MPGSTGRLTLPYPVGTDSADVPRDMLALANALDPSAAVFVQGTAATRPAAGVQGRVHFATDTQLLSYDTGTAWVTIGPTATSAVRPPLLSVLPGAPANGDEVYFQSAAGQPAWHLRYDSSIGDAYKWVFLGGAPLSADVAASDSTASLAFVQLATVGPSVTIPLAGIYDIEHGAEIANNTDQRGGAMSYAIGGGATNELDRAIAYMSVASGPVTTSTRRTKTIAAGTALASTYRAAGAGTATFQNRFLRAWPRRVG